MKVYRKACLHSPTKRYSIPIIHNPDTASNYPRFSIQDMKSWNTGRCCFWTCCCTGVLLAQRSFGFSDTTRNTLWLLRHGRSKANEAGRIVSQPANALLAEYGLSAVGREQARTAAATTFLTTAAQQDDAVLIITSDFTRAQETAEIVQQTIVEQAAPTRVVELHVDVRLRERDFGDWELTDDSNYAKVWADDADGIQNGGVESVTSVLERSRACIDEWNSRYENCCLVFVAHGDVLQIVQTSFTSPQLSPDAHRSLPHLETATPRRIS